LGQEGGGQPPLHDQPIAAVRLAPVESAAVEFRQVQRTVQDRRQQRLAIRPRRDRTGEFVLRLQQQLGMLALGDIDHRARGQQRLPAASRRTTRPRALNQIHRPSAVRSRYSASYSGLRSPAWSPRPRQHRRPIVRMDQAEPVLQADGNLFAAIAEEGAQVGIPDAAVGEVVILPDADAGGVEHPIKRRLQSCGCCAVRRSSIGVPGRAGCGRAPRLPFRPRIHAVRLPFRHRLGFSPGPRPDPASPAASSRHRHSARQRPGTCRRKRERLPPRSGRNAVRSLRR
jgi:hypothetical protein